MQAYTGSRDRSQADWLVQLDDLIGREQTAHLLRALKGRAFVSPSARFPVRNNLQCFIEESAHVTLIVKSVSDALLRSGHSCEVAPAGDILEIYKYKTGHSIARHRDATTVGENGIQSSHTLVLYLQSPESGGGTCFPELDLTLCPRPGSGLLFSQSMMHSAEVVTLGEKIVARLSLRLFPASSDSSKSYNK